MRKILDRLSLRTTLTVPFVAIVVTTVGLTGYLSFRSGQAAVTDLSDQLHREISARVQRRLESYLATPHLINQLNVDRVRRGELNIEDISNLEAPLLAQILQFENVTSIYYANEEAEIITAGRNTMGKRLI